MSDSATPWTAARQASLSIANSWSLLKLKSIEPVMPSNHLINSEQILIPSNFNLCNKGLHMYLIPSPQTYFLSFCGYSSTNMPQWSYSYQYHSPAVFCQYKCNQLYQTSKMFSYRLFLFLFSMATAPEMLPPTFYLEKPILFEYKTLNKFSLNVFLILSFLWISFLMTVAPKTISSKKWKGSSGC